MLETENYHHRMLSLCSKLEKKKKFRMKTIHVSSRLFIGSLRSASSLYLNQLCPLKLLSIYARSIVLHASRKRRFSSDSPTRRKNQKGKHKVKTKFKQD